MMIVPLVRFFVALGVGLAIPATPESVLEKLRREQQADRAERDTLTRKIKRRAKRIAKWADRARLVRRLDRKGVRSPWLVLTEADRASHEAGVPAREFRAMAIAVLEQETGIPQRAVYGCDHGPQGGKRPYCGDAVTKDNAGPFCRWVISNPYAGRMNGMHWTQTTWWEKIERVREERGGPHKARPHLRVCLGDLAVLRREHGRKEAFERYNGSGPAAEAYAEEVEGRFARWREVVTA